MISSSSDQALQKTHFPGIDVVRLIAATMIIFLHAWLTYKKEIGIPDFFLNASGKDFNSSGIIFNRLMASMNWGVDIFFLISGFLITHLLLIEKQVTGKLNIPYFFIRRILRIWPIYYLFILITPLIIYLTKSPQPDYLPHIFFVSNFHIINTHEWQFPLSHYWTISIEEHFYLVWPFLVLLFSIRKLVWVFLSVVLLSLLYKLLVFYYYESPEYYLYLHTFSRIDVLAIGGLAALYHHKKEIVMNIPRVVMILLLICLVVMMASISYSYTDTLSGLLIKRYGMLLLIALIIGAYVFSKRAEQYPTHWGIFHFGGKISYGLYIYHMAMIAIPVNNFFLYLFSVLAGTFILATLSYLFIESPILKFKERFTAVPVRTRDK